MLEGIFGREQYVAAKTMLDATEVRHRALAGNLANVETPGYRRVDLAEDFNVKLRAAVDRGDTDKLSALRAEVVEDFSARAARKDGNNVNMDEELLKMNQNSMQYEFLAQYVGGSLKSIRTAITGKVS